ERAERSRCGEVVPKLIGRPGTHRARRAIGAAARAYPRAVACGDGQRHRVVESLGGRSTALDGEPRLGWIAKVEQRAHDDAVDGYLQFEGGAGVRFEGCSVQLGDEVDQAG